MSRASTLNIANVDQSVNMLTYYKSLYSSKKFLSYASQALSCCLMQALSDFDASFNIDFDIDFHADFVIDFNRLSAHVEMNKKINNE